MEHTAYTF